MKLHGRRRREAEEHATYTPHHMLMFSLRARALSRGNLFVMARADVP